MNMYQPSCYSSSVFFLSFAISLIFFQEVVAQPEQQPEIGSRSIPILTVDGLRFRDLNRNERIDPYEDWRLSAEERSADLVSQMSLAEKVGTMLHGTVQFAEGQYDLDGTRRLLLEKHITSAITRLEIEPSELARQNNSLQELAEEGRLGIPLTLSSDPRNYLRWGAYRAAPVISMWPEPLGLASIGDLEIVRRLGEIVRLEYRAVGIHMALSPMADLATEPRWGRISATFGEEPERVRDLVRAYVEGIQGGRSGPSYDGVISVVKHWAGYGAAVEQGFDGHMAYGRWSGFPGGAFEKHLQAFEGAFEVQAAGVMPTYTILRDFVYEGHPMEPVGGGFNSYLLGDLLRSRYGFTGMILSDWGITEDCNCECMGGVNRDVMGGTPWGMEKASKLERYVKAVEAGVDQLGGSEEPEYLIEAVERGLLEEGRLDVSVRRILLDKFRIGLFENPYVSPEEALTVTSNPEAQAAGLAAQQYSLVLLKNEGALLPLRITGESGQTAAPRIYFLGVELDAAAVEARGLKVVTDPAQADLAIVRLKAPREVLHPDSRFGRSMAEGNLAFEAGQKDFDELASLAARGVPVIASVNLERPAVLTALLPHVRALFGDFGITHEAFLDVVLGKSEPKGRLPFELPSSMAAVEAQSSDVPHDSERPLFPIGFGFRYEGQR